MAGRDGTEIVAMDGFSGFKGAAAEELPAAVPVMEPFHVVRHGWGRAGQLPAPGSTNHVRHRGRPGDPLNRAWRTLQGGEGLLEYLKA